MRSKVIAVAVGLVFVGQVFAADVLIGNGATDASLPPNNNAVVIGDSATNSATSGQTTAVGAGATTSGTYNTAIGAGAIAGGSQFNTVVGNQASIAVGANVNVGTAIGAGAQILEGAGGTATINAVAIGASSVATQSNTVSFGVAPGAVPGYPTGYYRELVNISDATTAHSAVTLQQLNTAIAGVSGGTTDTTARNAAAAAQTTANTALTTANTAQATATAAQTTANTALTTANAAQVTANTANTNATTALNTVQGMNGRLDSLAGQVGDLSNRIGQAETGVVSSMAMSSASSSAAIAALRSARSMGLAVGAGTFNGKSATAFSFAAALPRATVTASVSLAGKPAAQVGAGWSF